MADQTTEQYLTAPLSILRSGSSELDVLEATLVIGITNAGVGFRERRGEESFAALLEQAKAAASPPQKEPSGDPYFWECAMVGAKLLHISGGNRAEDVKTWSALQTHGEVFFRIRADFFWNALHSARQAVGMDNAPRPLLSFREFRILAAILSAKVNRQNFSFLSWDSIQARACGYKSKREFAAGYDTLPSHCNPMGRRTIRHALERMEALGFFARFRYAKGARGGLTAYSFRHPTREALAESIGKWRAETQALKLKVAKNRAQDLLLSAAIQNGPSPSAQL